MDRAPSRATGDRAAGRDRPCRDGADAATTSGQRRRSGRYPGDIRGRPVGRFGGRVGEGSGDAAGTRGRPTPGRERTVPSDQPTTRGTSATTVSNARNQLGNPTVGATGAVAGTGPRPAQARSQTRHHRGGGDRRARGRRARLCAHSRWRWRQQGRVAGAGDDGGERDERGVDRALDHHSHHVVDDDESARVQRDDGECGHARRHDVHRSDKRLSNTCCTDVARLDGHRRFANMGDRHGFEQVSRFGQRAHREVTDRSRCRRSSSFHMR